MARTVAVRLKHSVDRSYNIIIEAGLLDSLPRILSRQWKGRKLYIISDSNVARFYGRKLLKQLHDEGNESLLLVFAAGEQAKNAATVNALHTRLLEHGIRRDSVVIALGGGVVGDIAGYVAATILRGVEFIQIPTTLLAHVDSSVGGKVGIDHPIGKNLIGAFHQPSAVYIDPNVLRTLPRAEFRNGLAEVVKIAAALDKHLFEFLERNVSKISKTNIVLLGELIHRSVRLKAAVVERDEFESDLRKVLNLGHTVGHAIEAASNFSMRHGEAVAMGIAAESKLAVALGLLHADEFNRVLQLLRRLKLPTATPTILSRARFLDAIAADKKSNGDAPRFVLLNAIGRSVIDVQISLSTFEKIAFPKFTRQ